MTFLTRYNSRAFEPFFARFNFLDDVQPSGTWAPPVDVAEDAHKISVKVEVPGMNESDLKVNFTDGVLTVSGERELERKEDSNYHRIERAYGSFVRTFTLPRSVDSNGIVASYKNGILEIEIPKKDEAKPKQIQINANAVNA